MDPKSAPPPEDADADWRRDTERPLEEGDPERRGWEELLGERLRPGDVLAEKYRLDALIGYGAMGFVVRAWHLQLEEPVAVKFLLPELSAHEEALVRFEREARAAFRIKSPHVARVLDVGRVEDGPPFMVMEFLEGEDLGRSIDRARLPTAEAVEYVAQACHAVAEAHSLGIVHRDLKPDNLFLARSRDGSISVKVLDFGLSKVLPRSSTERERAITGDAQVMGTAHYMSPEQWVATKDVGPAADIWSLGVILYEAITGTSPFFRNNLAAMCNAVLHDEPEPLNALSPDAPADLDAIVRRCLAKDPDDRYATALDLAQALGRFAPRPSTLPPPSVASASTQPAPPRARDLPRLGLVADDGTVDRWSDLLEQAPSRRPLVLWLGLAALVGVALWLLFGR